MIYLCSVYSIHAKTSSKADQELRDHRANYAMKVTASMISSGLQIFSPIAHCHEMSKHNGMPKEFQFWRNYDESMIDVSSCLFVLKMPHWEDSEGISHEIAYAKAQGKPVYYIDCPDYSEEQLLVKQHKVGYEVSKHPDFLYKPCSSYEEAVNKENDW